MTECNPHPDAPHGFDRNGSHNEDRYVCDCEHWSPPPTYVWIVEYSESHCEGFEVVAVLDSQEKADDFYALQDPEHRDYHFWITKWEVK